jgi:hypothetical protein
MKSFPTFAVATIFAISVNADAAEAPARILDDRKNPKPENCLENTEGTGEYLVRGTRQYRRVARLLDSCDDFRPGFQDRLKRAYGVP